MRVVDDTIRCADGLGVCPYAPRCERTAPADGLVSQAFFNGERETLGWCRYYMPVTTACEEEE